MDQGQPWGSTSEGWERRSETGEPGSHLQEADTERRKEIFPHFMVYGDAILPWPQHSDTAQVPTFGEGTGISTERDGAHLEKTSTWILELSCQAGIAAVSMTSSGPG